MVCELHPYAWPELVTRPELKGLVSAVGGCIRYLDQTAKIGEQADGSVLLER
jgi:hypothetical protein